MAKSCLFYLLRKMNHEVRTEWSVPNGYVAIVDQTTRTMYEIEFSTNSNFRNRKLELYKLTGYEVIIVPCAKLPTDIDGMSKFIEQYIVPD